MTIQDAHIDKVIFIGYSFVVPFSHSPNWLENLVDLGVIYLDESTGLTWVKYRNINTTIEKGDVIVYDRKTGGINVCRS